MSGRCASGGRTHFVHKGLKRAIEGGVLGAENDAPARLKAVIAGEDTIATDSTDPLARLSLLGHTAMRANAHHALTSGLLKSGGMEYKVRSQKQTLSPFFSALHLGAARRVSEFLQVSVNAALQLPHVGASQALEVGAGLLAPHAARAVPVRTRSRQRLFAERTR